MHDRDVMLGCKRPERCDVNLGDDQPTGVEVARWLRNNGYAHSIVFLTGHASSDARVLEASKMPRTRILSKPVPADELVALLKP